MADTPTVKTRRITRDKLAQVFKNHEMIKAFENLQEDVTGSIPEAIADSSTDADSVIGTGAFLQRPPITPQIPDDAAPVLSMASFIQRTPQTIMIDDGAARILATQIFGG